MTGHHYKCESPLDENNPNSLHHIGMISFPEIRYLLHTNGFRISEIKTNRTKFISYLYLIFFPLVYFSTYYKYYRTGRKEGTAEVNKSIFSRMFSKEILFGETLIVKAIKTTASN